MRYILVLMMLFLAGCNNIDNNNKIVKLYSQYDLIVKRYPIVEDELYCLSDDGWDNLSKKTREAHIKIAKLVLQDMAKVIESEDEYLMFLRLYFHRPISKDNRLNDLLIGYFPIINKGETVVKFNAAFKYASRRCRDFLIHQLFSCIPQIIPFIKNNDEQIRQSALSILQSLTNQDFGNNTAQWLEWWNENQELIMNKDAERDEKAQAKESKRLWQEKIKKLKNQNRKKDLKQNKESN